MNARKFIGHQLFVAFLLGYVGQILARLVND